MPPEAPQKRLSKGLCSEEQSGQEVWTVKSTASAEKE